eukprot:scaffold619309_cov46-Prasinocladus_malaysianus.AAC.1
MAQSIVSGPHGTSQSARHRSGGGGVSGRAMWREEILGVSRTACTTAVVLLGKLCIHRLVVPLAMPLSIFQSCRY